MKHLYILLFLFLGTYFAFAQVPTYDILGRITWEVYPDGTTIHYEYEPGGNRFKKTTLACTPPLAAFSPAAAGLSVAFTNTTPNATSTTWDFGDGSTSSLANPTHIYAAAGNYTVTMTVANACTTSVATQVLAVTNQNCTIPGLLAYYTLDANANDFSGNNHHASSVGSPQYSTGYLNNAIQLSSSVGDNVLLPSLINNATTAFTISIWVKEQSMSNPDGEGYVFFGDHSNSGWAGIMHVNLSTTNSICFGVNGTSQPIMVNVPSNYQNNFIHYVMTFNNGVVNAYINGQNVGTANQTLNIANTNAALGKHWWSNGGTNTTRFNGQMDEVRFYDHAITPQQVQDLYQGNIPPIALFNQTSSSLTTTFTNTSINATSYSWNFGDGTSSTLQNPSHTYASAGTYSVSLTVSNSCGTNTSTQSVTVNCPPTTGTSLIYSGTNTNPQIDDQGYAYYNGTHYLVWSNGTYNGNGAYGNYDAKVKISTSPDGITWTTQDILNTTYGSMNHVLTIDNNGKLHIAYVEGTSTGYYGLPSGTLVYANNVNGTWVKQNTNLGTGNGNSYNWSTPYQLIYGYDGKLRMYYTTTGWWALGAPLYLRVLDNGVWGSPITISNANAGGNDSQNNLWSFTKKANGQISVYLSAGWLCTGGGCNPSYYNTFKVFTEGANYAYSQTNTIPNTRWYHESNGSVLSVASDGQTISLNGSPFTVLPASEYLNNNTWLDQQASKVIVHTNTNSRVYSNTGQSLVNGTSKFTIPAVGFQIVADFSTNPRTVYVDWGASSSPITANFTQTSNGLMVTFTNTSTNATTYSWNFGNGQTSTLQNPSVTYAASGTYTVCLTASDGCGTNQYCTQVTVICTPPTVSISANIPVACNGGANGSATISATGGIAPYTYTWNTTPPQYTTTATNLAAGTYSVTVKDAVNCSASAGSVITQPTTALSAAASTQTNVSCNQGTNGVASVIANGGTSPYTYTWNTMPIQYTSSANNLPAGNQTVTVIDANGCTATASTVVTQPVNLSLVTNVINATCNGATGSADAIVSGGVAPYTYTWNTNPVQNTSTATNLAAGNYNVVVKDANNCQISASVSITQPSAIVATISTPTNVSCNGGNNGSATVVATGGASPYTYTWNTTPPKYTATASTLTAGSYMVTVKDGNNCTATASVSITQPTILNLTTSKTNILCNGGANGSASVVVSGGTSPYTYTWNTSPAQYTSSISSLVAGTYTITVKDNKNCISTASVSITQPNVLSLATTQTNISCSGGANGSATVSPSGGTTPYTYTWSTNPVQYTATINNLSVGNYNVIVKDANNCTQNVTVNITIPTALTAISTTTDISCFGGNNGTASVNVSGGTSPYAYTWNTNPIQTSATAINLSVGNYIVSITDVNGCSLIKNVVINQPLNALLATISTQTNVSCNNGNNGAASILAVGGTAPYTYTWNTNPVQNLAVASGLSAGTYNCSVIDSKNCITNLNVSISEPNPLSLSLTSNLVSCFGGSNGTIIAAGSGGTNPYQYKQTGGAYSSNNVFSGLSAGFYSIIVQDVNNCTATQNITVSQSSQISFSSPISVTNVSCNGGNNGTINPSIIGGTLPYTYSWNTIPMQFTQNASGLSAGTYILSVVDANGCAANSSSINITQPNLLVNNVTSSIIPSCYGGANGSINTTTTGGTAPYTYTWNSVPPKFTSNANGLIAGTYTLTTVDSKGCIDTTIKVLSQPTAVVATSILTQNVSCNGGANGTITIVGSGGVPPYTYNINTQTYGSTNIFTGLAAANYIVHIKDANNCIIDTLVSVTQPNVLTSSVSINQPLCFGNTASATINTIGGASPYTYSWSSGQTTSTVSNLAVGTYNVLATDTNGCTNSQNITITQPNDIIVSISATNPLCYGQQGTLNATASGGVGTLNYSWSSGQITPTINAVAGVYTVSVTDNNGCSKTLTQTLTSPSAITASVLSSPVNCGGGNNGQANVLAVGGVSPYTYSWWHNGATTQMVNGLLAGNYTVSIFDNNNCSVTATANITEPDAPNIIISQTDAGCFGTNTGSADATIVGGYAPFSYSWSNGVINSNVNANIGAGVYYLTIVDATGCAYMDSVNISQSSPIQIFTNQINLSCYGASNASASALAINGASPYVYSWSNGTQNNLTNGLSAGNYAVYVTDASGCMQTDTITILQPNAIIVQQSSVSPVCSNAINGSISVNATGGNGSPYSYSWNTGFVGNTITNIGANTYTVYVKDAQQCLHTEQITLIAPIAPSIGYSVIDKKCNGGENDGSIGALVISTIGETFTYSWSNGSTNQQINNLAAGNYISYITSNLGCVYIDTVTVSQPAPFVIVTNNPQPGVATANVVSGGTPPYVYMWYLTPPQYADSVGGLTAGIYAVIIQDVNKCSDTANVVVLYSTSINPPLQWHPLWSVYPNPTKDNLFVAYEGNGAILRIYDPLGKEISSQIITSATTQIDISMYSIGTYTIELSTKDGTMKAIQKIIKE